MPNPSASTTRRRRTAALIALALALALTSLGGCSTLGYYAHLASGEARVLSKRQPIDRMIADPGTDPSLRERLRQVQRARRFASAHLDLPRNRSYTTYADIGRPFVMYNVFATPALSLKPVTHCFLFAGCVAYQGFYRLERARKAANRLKARGDDVYIGGVPAYSTLGHFADPVLSSMNRWSEDELIGTIFHELAHQKRYVKGDTRFNESFATFVQHEGLREWHRREGIPATDTDAEVRERQFTQLVLAARRRLEHLYESDLDDADKLKRKQAAFENLRSQYRQMRDHDWHGRGDYDAWIEAPLNNAKLLPFGLYDQWEPAFAHLFVESGRQWPAFFAAVKRLAKQPKAVRDARLQALIPEQQETSKPSTSP